MYFKHSRFNDAQCIQTLNKRFLIMIMEKLTLTWVFFLFTYTDCPTELRLQGCLPGVFFSLLNLHTMVVS